MRSSEKSPSGSITKYYIYHDGEEHFIISPTPKPPKKKKKRKKQDPEQPSPPAEIIDDKDSYFVHRPYLSFHHPPRTLRRGGSKHGTPICLIHNSWWWKQWKIQFGERLADAVDPRGVVNWEYCGNVVGGDDALKGYKVRSWRLWGESGKEYHREVNARRKENGERQGQKEHDRPTNSQSKSPIVEEVVYLDWTSPFSTATRRYHFRYSGIDFYWKGTSVTSGEGKFLRYNHLKLVVRLPQPEQGDMASINSNSTSEVCLARYASSLAPDMAGVLELFDSVIKDCFHDQVLYAKGNESKNGAVDVVIPTRIHDILLATAMCMIIGEWEKRTCMTSLLSAAVSAGG